MVKVSTICRSELEWTKDRNGEIPRAHRNYDPKQNPMARETEYVRAIRGAKLDRMFAKPFVGSLAGHQDTVLSLALDPCNVSTLVSGSADGGLCIWDASMRRMKGFVQAHRHSVTGIAFTPDSVAFLSCSQDKTVRLWDSESVSETCSPVVEFLGHSSFTSIDHHRRKCHFVTTGNVVQIWDVNRTLPLHDFVWGDDSVTFARFNRIETDLVACCMADRGVLVFDARAKAGHNKVIMELCCSSVCWSPMDPNVLVAGSDDWHCYLFDMRVPGRPKSVFQGHIHAVTSVDFCPTGKEFAAGSTDCTVRTWSLNQQTKSTSQEMFHTKRMAKIYCVAWSLDNTYIFSGSEDANLRIWKADSSKPIRPLRGCELNSFNYLRSLKDKYKLFPEVKRIVSQRNTPKAIRKVQLRRKKIQIRQAVKEMSLKKSDNLVPLAKRKVVQSLK